MKPGLREIFAPGVKLLASQTAKDTFLVMIANATNGFTGLALGMLIARHLTVAGFGTFSSLMNLTLILVAIVDLGMAQGVVNFVSSFAARKKDQKIQKYLSNMICVVLSLGVIVTILLQLTPGRLIFKLAGTSNRLYLLLAGLAVITFSLYPFFLGVFQTFRKFLARTVIELTFDASRIVFLGLLILTTLTIDKAFLAYVLGALVGFIVIWRFWPTVKVKLGFSLKTFKDIFQFTRWLWLVNMIINVYGKIDVLILTALTSSLIVGQYAAAARLALVFPMAANALNAVVSPRFASFGDKQSATKYIKKTFILTLGVTFALAAFFLIAKPLILTIYGSRYLESVSLFKGLVLANIPFLLALPATNCLVYFSKKPSLITGVSFLQLIVMVVITWILMPSLKAFAPIYGFFAANILGLTLIYLLLFKFHFQKERQ